MRHRKIAAMQDTAPALSPGEAALLLGVNPKTLRRWAADGLIPSFVTPGGWRRFSRADIDAFIASRKTEAAS